MIYRILGRPNFVDWPHLNEYPNNDDSFWLKEYETSGLDLAVPSLDDIGLDLLQVCVVPKMHSISINIIRNAYSMLLNIELPQNRLWTIHTLPASGKNMLPCTDLSNKRECMHGLE